MLLQAYFDDSGSHTDSEWYVIAGILATKDQWHYFSDEWAAYLLQDPPLEYFKMSEANGLLGQFRGFTPALRDQKVEELANITEKYAVARISAIISRSEFNTYLKDATHFREFKTPYWFLFYQSITSTLDFVNKLGQNTTTDVSNFEIDFIFDEQGSVGEESLEWWSAFKCALDRDRSRFLGSSPVFRSDRKILPLQAADLYAWHARHVFGGGDNSVRTKAVVQTLGKITPYGWMVTGDKMKSSLPDLIAIAERYRPE